MSNGGATLAELCAVVCAEVFRGSGEVLASPIGTVPMIGGRLAQATFEPDLMLTDGEALLLTTERTVEGWMPYRSVFDVVWSGRRHVIMGATQIDRNGNQNIACIGPWEKPKAQLLGVRGAPGNTVNHATSYWVPNHSTRTFVEAVDMVSGVGYRRAAEAGPSASRFHHIHRVVSNKGVFDFETPDHAMHLRSLHPGVTVDEVREATGFELAVADDVEETPAPTDEQLRLIREVFDPGGVANNEVKP
jgi:acyl CoA:acetate/3-ketoacid CoA transferase beta subunit